MWLPIHVTARLRPQACVWAAMECVRIIVLPIALLWVLLRLLLLLVIGLCKAALILPSVVLIVWPGYLSGLLILFPKDVGLFAYTAIRTPVSFSSILAQVPLTQRNATH